MLGIEQTPDSVTMNIDQLQLIHTYIHTYIHTRKIGWHECVLAEEEHDIANKQAERYCSDE
jgi:hypothetical protein